jgi:hypothetical protein
MSKKKCKFCSKFCIWKFDGHTSLPVATCGRTEVELQLAFYISYMEILEDELELF